ncbi:hypothetical protein DM02DRAFT_285065 [Periconia macrospinosa]|uniref:Uncharacterized protein n=1 Tax=Periconia macrospinosa TaxID=97972 RepID=A0A2V1EE10_9PLEO|nr:hypothetical protein DM02DRAFT_285065 [Periconia macrospinosa]
MHRHVKQPHSRERRALIAGEMPPLNDVQREWLQRYRGRDTYRPAYEGQASAENRIERDHYRPAYEGQASENRTERDYYKPAYEGQASGNRIECDYYRPAYEGQASEENRMGRDPSYTDSRREYTPSSQRRSSHRQSRSPSQRRSYYRRSRSRPSSYRRSRSPSHHRSLNTRRRPRSRPLSYRQSRSQPRRRLSKNRKQLQSPSKRRSPEHATQNTLCGPPTPGNRSADSTSVEAGEIIQSPSQSLSRNS